MNTAIFSDVSEISRTSQGLRGTDTDSDSNHSNVDSDTNHNVTMGNQQSANTENSESDAGVVVANPGKLRSLLQCGVTQ